MWEVVNWPDVAHPLRSGEADPPNGAVVATAPDEFMAVVLPPALELTTANTASDQDPALFVETLRRVVGDSMSGTDPTTAMAQLLFGLSALNGILLDDLADQSGMDKAALLANVHRLYVSH